MDKVTKMFKGIAAKYNGVALILRIVIGMIIGTILALTVPGAVWIGEFGTLFVSALKAIAPILVFVLVASALAQGSSKLDRRFGLVLWLYLFTTFMSAVVAVFSSRLFPQTLALGKAAKSDVVPQGLSEVAQNMLTAIVTNPIQSMIDGNYIGILLWACLFGLAMKGIASESSKTFMANVADSVSQLIRWIINLAPFGIMGLIFTNVSENGLSTFAKYGSLLLLLVGHHAVHGAGGRPGHHVRLPAPKPVSAGVPLLQGIRSDRVLHPQLRGEHPGQHAAVREARTR